MAIFTRHNYVISCLLINDSDDTSNTLKAKLDFYILLCGRPATVFLGTLAFIRLRRGILLPLIFVMPLLHAGTYAQKHPHAHTHTYKIF